MGERGGSMDGRGSERVLETVKSKAVRERERERERGGERGRSEEREKNDRYKTSSFFFILPFVSLSLPPSFTVMYKHEQSHK